MTESKRGHAIIVGAGPGMGLALARRFGRGGFHVSLVGRRADALASYVRKLGRIDISSAGFPGDAGDSDSLRSAIDAATSAHGPCEVLCYNPAGRHQGPLAETDPEDLVRALRVNVIGALVAVQEVLPEMQSRGRGTILLTGGGLALRSMQGMGALAIGKASQRSLAQALGMELAASGVYVGTILIAGYVQRQTRFDPDLIADEFWRLHAERPAEREIIYR